MTRDNEYSPFAGRRREPPTPILVNRLWRARKTESMSVLSCATYLHPCGIEVRCGYGNEELLLMSWLERTPMQHAHALMSGNEQPWRRDSQNSQKNRRMQSKLMGIPERTRAGTHVHS